MPADLDDPTALFSAVGRATSAWETLEAHLSYLYSIFVGKPMLVDALEEYGRDRTTVPARMAELCKVGKAYFTKFPSQELEAMLADIIKDTRALSGKRHQIAHGIVHTLPAFTGAQDEHGWYIPSPGFLLMPPWHALYNLARKGKEDQYRYGSREIGEWTQKFLACAERAKKIADLLNERG
jgi:hypothetical protein